VRQVRGRRTRMRAARTGHSYVTAAVARPQLLKRNVTTATWPKRPPTAPMVRRVPRPGTACVSADQWSPPGPPTVTVTRDSGTRDSSDGPVPVPAGRAGG
jgi:hypothetical protein